jgi:hypothetical protein
MIGTYVVARDGVLEYKGTMLLIGKRGVTYAATDRKAAP